MKPTILLITLSGLLLLGCNQKELEHQSQIEELATKVESLQQALEEEKEKVELASSFLAISPLQRFFLDADNEGIFDVSRACLNACATKLVESKKACENAPSLTEKCACITEVEERATACVLNCPGLSIFAN